MFMNMSSRVLGFVHGNTVKLDRSVDQLDGKRVRVVLEALDESEDAVLSAEQQKELWAEWVAHGPQGPIEDEAESDFP